MWGQAAWGGALEAFLRPLLSELAGPRRGSPPCIVSLTGPGSGSLDSWVMSGTLSLLFFSDTGAPSTSPKGR